MKKSVTVLTALLSGLVLHAQTNASWIKNIPADRLIAWRRHIHENPELSFKEELTGKYVEGVLRELPGIEIVKPAATSIIGILKGSKPGKTVLFRADMDALPVQEETGLSYSSKVPNVSHVCGHDAHTAMLLATATALSRMREQIRGTVYFLFQHAEEQTPGGAIDIVQSGALKGVNAIFGMHVFSNYPVGHIGILPGTASTAGDGFRLVITGKGSHGSMPQLGIDPIVVGAEIVIALQTIVSRNVVPGEMTVVTVGKFQSGEAANVGAEKAELLASVRTTTDVTRKLVETRVDTLVRHITQAYGATYDLEYVHGYPAIQNDAQLNAQARNSAAAILGKENVFDASMLTVSEDFSYYKEVAPECFIILGVGNGVANHNPKFNIDESALLNGVKVQIQVILDYLNK